MATSHGVPGEWARVRGTVLSLWPLFLACVLLGAFGMALVLARAVLPMAALFILTLGFTAFAWRKGVRHVASFFIGARGEERVAGHLATLPADCHVFNDFLAGSLHVDHVVIGPAGVFAVETKNWAGAVTVEDGHVLVNGHLADRAPLQQAQRQAEAVRAALARAGWEGPVCPVLCFASNTFAAGQAAVGGVTVVNVRDLVGWIAAHPATLAPDERTRLVKLTLNR